MKYRLTALGIAGIVVILDQLTKLWVSQTQPHFSVIPGFFNINYVENTGAAFGILQGRQVLLAVVSALAIGVLLFLIVREREGKWAMLAALALILGGTCGNLIDRVRQGYVIDFLHFYIKHYHWPSFNVADSAITVGVLSLLLVTLSESRQTPESELK